MNLAMAKFDNFALRPTGTILFGKGFPVSGSRISVVNRPESSSGVGTFKNVCEELRVRPAFVVDSCLYGCFSKPQDVG